MNFDKLQTLKSNDKGQATFGGFLEAVVGIVVIIVYFSLYAALNKDSVDAATLSMINIIGVVLGASLVIRLIIRGFTI